MKIRILILASLFYSCDSQKEQVVDNGHEKNSEQEQTSHLSYFEDKDSLGNIIGSFYVDENDLYCGELITYFSNGEIQQKFEMLHDTVIGYVIENDTKGRLHAYKNYQKPMFEDIGDVNEIIFYDTLGIQNEGKSI
jgi:hypothetical protein